MKVLKFGGASVRDAESVRNVARILSRYINDSVCVVLSAMGKTTNALEKVAQAWFNQDIAAFLLLEEVEKFHISIAKELLGGAVPQLTIELQAIRSLLQSEPPPLFDSAYDRIVCRGEFLSTALVGAYLQQQQLSPRMLDASQLVITDESFRNARINWEETTPRIRAVFNGNYPLTITQGFIGFSLSGHPVTLGREGSDFSAAIFAFALEAEEVIIWKDVPGLLNADPRLFKQTKKLDRISYRDAIELAYFGASVIHPKTIQPLQNKHIPLYIKPFADPEATGTLIHDADGLVNTVPSYIVKPDQVLVSISPLDFSFIAEHGLHTIFGLLSHIGIHINMMQNSAISFSICIDDHDDKLQRLLMTLSGDFRVRYNRDLELITIRYYNQRAINKLVGERNVLLEQKSRLTVQMVVEQKKAPDKD
ncbi:MAG: aspartate kinase [Lentimicrobium sp.]|jgi:aspartate kinase|nr:aspartate kinase [Lentimicrobium sp.]